jgi:hypothetical protein
MAFVDIFNFKKYITKPSDATTARIGHVNALYDALQQPEKNYYDVAIKIELDGDTNQVKYTVVYNEIPSTLRALRVIINQNPLADVLDISISNSPSGSLTTIDYSNVSVSTNQIITGAGAMQIIDNQQTSVVIYLGIQGYLTAFANIERPLWINLRLFKDLI